MAHPLQNNLECLGAFLTGSIPHSPGAGVIYLAGNFSSHQKNHQEWKGEEVVEGELVKPQGAPLALWDPLATAPVRGDVLLMLDEDFLTVHGIKICFYKVQ